MHLNLQQRSLLILIILTFICSALLFFPFKLGIVFIDSGDDAIEAYSLLEQPHFQISYTHSIHLSDVVESFEVLPDNTLKLIEMEYEDFNVGMPSNAENGEVFIEKNGKYYIKNMDRRMPEFRLLVGDVDAGLYLLKNDKELDLKKTLQRGKIYTFRIQRLSYFQRIKGVNIDEQ